MDSLVSMIARSGTGLIGALASPRLSILIFHRVHAWVPLLMRMVQVSLVGFAAGGAFLSLVYFDLPYYIVGYVVLVDATLREREKSNPIAQLSEKKTTIISKPLMANSK